MSNSIILRVQSPAGLVKRLSVNKTESCRDLYEKIKVDFDLNTFNFALFKQRNKTEEITSTKEQTVSSIGLKNGDFVYMMNLSSPDDIPSTSNHNFGSMDTSRKASTMPSTPTEFRSKLNQNSFSSSTSSIVEDEVDKELWNTDGKVKRKRDEKLCRHGSNALCIHCSPLEPFDESYLKEQNVKHMSFHAYLRKKTSGADRGKFVFLEDLSCRIKEGCKGHPPWPKGICSKCQPNAVTLNRQTYRHVDNIVFENANLVERFLEYWRLTGHQRIGFLYGKYQVHTDVPLGIKASVAAIYEPPQESSRDKIKLLPDPKAVVVDDVARSLGLTKVGWIFTDLVAEDLQKGTVKHTRNIESHFLSAHECIMAGNFQNAHPNPSRFSSSGYFGSKFVTVCVTGDKENQVHMEGYAVSNQCMALVRDKCLIPTKDAPELGYIKESTDKQYVPDVFYKVKDNYGNEVSRLARPLPVEYLLVDIPAATPMTPIYTFFVDPTINHFPVEHRMVDGHFQDFNSLSKYLSQFTPDQFYNTINDFHLLIYIATMDMMPMRENMDTLLEAIFKSDKNKINEWSKSSDQWATLEQLIAVSNNTGGGSISGALSSYSSFNHNIPSAAPSTRSSNGGSPGIEFLGSTGGVGGNEINPTAEWTCPHCTFLNLPHLSNCEMCNLPK